MEDFWRSKIGLHRLSEKTKETREFDCPERRASEELALVLLQILLVPDSQEQVMLDADVGSILLSCQSLRSEILLYAIHFLTKNMYKQASWTGDSLESLHNHGDVSNSSDGKPEGISVRKINGIDARNGKDHAVVVSKEEAEPEKKSLWKNWGMIASIAVYCIWGLHDMAYSEIFSLWAVSPQSYGGLGFTTSEVGNVLAAAGAALLVFQLFVFAALANRFGAIQMIRIPAVLSVPLVAVYPLFARLDGVSLWITLIIAAIVKNVLSISIVTGSFLLINNSVMVRQRGFANGLSMTFMSLFKALGPAGAGILFSWAQERINSSFLPGMWSIFVILDIIVVITFVGTFEPILPSSLLNPVQEIDGSEPIKDEKLQRASSFTFD